LVIKDGFAAFAGRDYFGEVRFPASAEGKAKLYQEQEKKKAELRKE
jgi:hypothetical protein